MSTDTSNIPGASAFLGMDWQIAPQGGVDANGQEVGPAEVPFKGFDQIVSPALMRARALTATSAENTNN